MLSDPYERLDVAIASSARERDIKQKARDDETAARARARDEATRIWSQRKSELPGIVEIIDQKLRENQFFGASLGTFELKHSDIARAVIDFAHTPHQGTKILFRVTSACEYICSIGVLAGHVTSARGPIAQLTDNRFKEVLALAVAECLSGNPGSQTAEVANEAAAP
jgi:hypothetical protein